MSVAHHHFEDISVGDSDSFSVSFKEEDVMLFAKLSGDINPLHVDEAYANTTRFKKRIVHGMLVGSLCSRFVGTLLPGKTCLYLKQSLIFREPVYIGDTLNVTGTVTRMSVSTRILEITFSIQNNNKEAVTGVATVQML